VENRQRPAGLENDVLSQPHHAVRAEVKSVGGGRSYIDSMFIVILVTQIARKLTCDIIFTTVATQK
jgi:hypothetical protein